MYQHTKEFRTVHSICDEEIEWIMLRTEGPDFKTFIDFGCHLGHLSFEMAIRNGMNVIAVDNFVGSVGDSYMAKTFEGMPDGFKHIFDANMEKVKHLFKGNVRAVYCDEFWSKIVPEITGAVDAIFVDSSHRVEESSEFQRLGDLLRSGGQFMGHDYSDEFKKGVVEPVDALYDGGKYCNFLKQWRLWNMTRK